MMCHRSSGEGTRSYHQSHPPAPKLSAARRTTLTPRGDDRRDSRGLTTHLHRARRAEQLLEGAELIGAAGDEYPDPIVAELGIVRDAALPQQHREERDGRHRAQGAEQDGQLEADDHVWRNRADRLAADHQWPVVRHPEGHAETRGTAREAAD